MLLRAGADANAKLSKINVHSLFIAAERATRLLNLLLAHSVPARKKWNGLTSLHIAALSGSIKIVDSLIRAGARVDTKGDGGRTPLFNVVSKPSAHKMVALLVQRGANVQFEDLDGVSVFKLR